MCLAAIWKLPQILLLHKHALMDHSGPVQGDADPVSWLQADEEGTREHNSRGLSLDIYSTPKYFKDGIAQIQTMPEAAL